MTGSSAEEGGMGTGGYEGQKKCGSAKRGSDSGQTSLSIFISPLCRLAQLFIPFGKMMNCLQYVAV